MAEQESKYNILASKYPELIGNSHFGGFCVGEGWFNIIDRLCGMIYHQVKQHNDDVAYRMSKVIPGTVVEHDDDDYIMWEMPKIRQVKEKFGTLRFYMDTNIKRFRHYVDFAEVMSAVTCDECGAPGSVRNSTSWVHVMCDEHEAGYLEEVRVRDASYGFDTGTVDFPVEE
jgi:hypothetical protein